MGVKLLNEVLDHAPADWTQAERLFIAVLAEKARDTTRRAWPGQATIIRRTGLKPDSVTRLCHRLAVKGWELREQQGVDRKGKPVFAYRGQAAVYAIPPMCPLGEHDPDVCFPSKARTVVRPFSVTDSDEEALDSGPNTSESPDPGPGLTPESPDGGPAIDEESPDDGPAIPQESPDGGPGFSEKARTVVRESPDGGPPLTVIEPSKFNPQPEPAPNPGAELFNPVPTQRNVGSLNRWATTNTKPQRQGEPSNPARPARQSALFATTDVKISDREQVVLDWLRGNDYLNATPADAKAVDKIVRQAYPGKTVGYLRGIAAGTGFGAFYEQMRVARSKAVTEQIRRLEKTSPACEHGTPAGRTPHPTHGGLLCAQCRAGIRPTSNTATTHPDVAAALNAYRDAHTGPLPAAELISVTQQAEALRARGATRQQLTELARKAAHTGCGLIAAAVNATQEDVPA